LIGSIAKKFKRTTLDLKKQKKEKVKLRARTLRMIVRMSGGGAGRKNQWVQSPKLVCEAEKKNWGRGKKTGQKRNHAGKRTVVSAPRRGQFGLGRTFDTKGRK